MGPREDPNQIDHNRLQNQQHALLRDLIALAALPDRFRPQFDRFRVILAQHRQPVPIQPSRQRARVPRAAIGLHQHLRRLFTHKQQLQGQNGRNLAPKSRNRRFQIPVQPNEDLRRLKRAFKQHRPEERVPQRAHLRHKRLQRLPVQLRVPVRLRRARKRPYPHRKAVHECQAGIGQ